MPQLQGHVAVTYLDHVAVLDDGPQQFPVFCLVLLLLQVCSVLCMEKEDWSGSGNSGLHFSAVMQSPRSQSVQAAQEPAKLSTRGEGRRRQQGPKSPAHPALAFLAFLALLKCFFFL